MTATNNSISIKLTTTELPAKALMELKKLTGLSPSEIKNKVAADDYLLVFSYSDRAGLKLMNQIRDQMKRYGIGVQQFINGKVEPPCMFDNLMEQFIDTSLEVGLSEEDIF